MAGGTTCSDAQLPSGRPTVMAERTRAKAVLARLGATRGILVASFSVAWSRGAKQRPGRVGCPSARPGHSHLSPASSSRLGVIAAGLLGDRHLMERTLSKSTSHRWIGSHFLSPQAFSVQEDHRSAVMFLRRVVVLLPAWREGPARRDRCVVDPGPGGPARIPSGGRRPRITRTNKSPQWQMRSSRTSKSPARFPAAVVSCKPKACTPASVAIRRRTSSLLAWAADAREPISGKAQGNHGTTMSGTGSAWTCGNPGRSFVRPMV